MRPYRLPARTTDVPASPQIEPQRPVRGVAGAVDAHARADGDACIIDVDVALGEEEASPIEWLAIEAAIDVHRRAHFSRSVHQIEIAFRFRPPLVHRLDP